MSVNYLLKRRRGAAPASNSGSRVAASPGDRGLTPPRFSARERFHRWAAIGEFPGQSNLDVVLVVFWLDEVLGVG